MKPSPAKKREVFMTVKWVVVVVVEDPTSPLQENRESSMEETFIGWDLWRIENGDAEKWRKFYPFIKKIESE